jgi:hypothetical protein
MDENSNNIIEFDEFSNYLNKDKLAGAILPEMEKMEKKISFGYSIESSSQGADELSSLSHEQSN